MREIQDIIDGLERVVAINKEQAAYWKRAYRKTESNFDFEKKVHYEAKIMGLQFAIDSFKKCSGK